MVRDTKLRESSYVLIDLSSYVFYRNYAIQRWRQAAQIDEADFPKEAFMEKFESLFVSKLMDIKKKFRVPASNIILAKDCARKDIWRKDIFPSYKENRVKDINNFDPDVFIVTYNKLVHTLIKEHGFLLIQSDHAESDDIIAVMTKYLIENSKPNEITVLTMDTDFLQLESNNVIVQVMDFNFKRLNEKPYISKVIDIYILWKVICGDKSDGIPGIAERIGPVTAEKLARNKELLHKKLEDDDIRANYLRNDILINFINIPKHITTDIIENYIRLKNKN